MLVFVRSFYFFIPMHKMYRNAGIIVTETLLTSPAGLENLIISEACRLVSVSRLCGLAHSRLTVVYICVMGGHLESQSSLCALQSALLRWE